VTTEDWIDFGLLLTLVAPLGAWCGYLGYKLLRRGPGESAPAVEAKKHGIALPILVVVGGYFLFAYAITPILFGLLYSLYFADTSPTIESWVRLSYVNFSYSAAAAFFQLILLFSYLRWRGSSLQSIGFNRPMPRHILNGLIAYGLYFLIYLGVFALIYTFIPAIDLDQEQQLGFAPITGFDRLLTFGALVILPPIAEEIMTRGLLYHSLKARLKKNAAIIATSALFAVAHLQLGSGGPPLWVAAVDTFVLSVVLIRVTDYSRSLWPAIIAHMIKNAVAFVSLFILAR
jgi:uncharacterized protein